MVDDRPDCWLVGLGEEDFFVQQGDFVFKQAAAAAAQDPLAFIVPPYSSSGASGAWIKPPPHLNLFKITDVLHDSLTASSFWSDERSLLKPPQYQEHGVQELLPCSSVSGRVIHVLP